MIETGVGRLLVASLHQGIADLLPARLEFYESWLNPNGLREGRIGLAPMAAVLSFLRQEGDVYRLIAARAGEYAGEWTVAELSGVRRAIIAAAPPRVRARLVMRTIRKLVRLTYPGSRVTVRWRQDKATFGLQDSIFCSLRDRTDGPMCEFYASAIRRVMHLLSLEVEIATDRCRATGAEQCTLTCSFSRSWGNGRRAIDAQ
jgi:predicted hydrocarbon binding protein